MGLELALGALEYLWPMCGRGLAHTTVLLVPHSFGAGAHWALFSAAMFSAWAGAHWCRRVASLIAQSQTVSKPMPQKALYGMVQENRPAAVFGSLPFIKPLEKLCVAFSRCGSNCAPSQKEVGLRCRWLERS